MLDYDSFNHWADEGEERERERRYGLTLGEGEKLQLTYSV